MKRTLLACFFVTAAACVDLNAVDGFECDGSTCRDWATGAGGGSVTGGGGGSGGGATGGSGGGSACNATTCSGCCDDADTCHPGNTAVACGVSGNSCNDCGADARCVSAVCQPLVATGATCAHDSDCLSGFCADNVCCESACTGSCERCNAAGTPGTCSLMPASATVTACGAYACDGLNANCPTSCTATWQCATGHYCGGDTCRPLKTAGESCAGNFQCVTGFCADGVCCDSQCSGSCDECLTSGAGKCMPADAGHPGAPACPEPIVCNGSLPDCPITCASGCPADTWCSGEYCSAKKPPGAVCGAAVECSSGFCTDGVCCDTACNGACEACSAAQGAPGDGVCTLLGSSHVCRAAGSNCDREERCTGASAACPNDGFHDAGTSCGNTMTTGWGGCDAGAGCGTMGVQTRTRTDYVCAGSSATCNTVNTPETQACTRPTEGVSCGSTGYSDWTDCNYPSVCATTTTRTRVRTDPVCASGACTAMQTTETDTCNRPTENVSCGDAGYTGWSSCTWPDTCSLSGSRTRTRTDPVCQSGNCGSTMATETDTAGCDRPTNGNNCGDAGYSMWSDCDYPTACATAGLRSRSVTTYTCGSGNCNTSTNTEVDSTTCMRPTNGNNCGTTEYGDCVYASPCATTGNRQVITWVCNGSQTCVSMTSTETNAPACNRLTTGDPCDTTQYNCVYPGGTCANSGNRQVTTWTCNSSATCVSSTTTEPNSPSCARNTNGEVCDPTNCGLCINSCNCNCQNYRNCTSYTCSNQVCVGQNYQEDCGACNPGRGGCNLCKDGETR